MVTHAYDPFKMFYVKKFRMPRAEGTEIRISNYVMFLEVLGQLSKRTLSGHAALDSLETLFSTMSEVEQKWYARILQKDLKIGITSGTVNRTHDALGTGFKIPTFSCALAETYKPKRIPRRFVIEPKLDGYRCLAFRYDTHVELRSRNGKPIEGYASIEKAMEGFPPGYVYDGEIMSLSGKFSDMQAMAGRKGVDDKPGIFNIFDVVAIDEFFTGVSEELYFVRRIRLEEFFGAAEQSPVLALVDVIATGSTEREGKDPNEVRAQAEEMIMLTHRDLLAKGYEGSMLKDADGYYECKRSWGIQKVKDMDNLDLLVIGVEPGIPNDLKEQWVYCRSTTKDTL
jgi:ATP-dependent DNA ligase